MMIPLSYINPGDSARIICLANDIDMAARLRDLGFISGSMISCVLQKPNKHIAAYLVRGTVIALREKDSRFILVEKEDAR